MNHQKQIIVTGLIGSIPLAGLTLHYLQYVLGLRALGHDVFYLEDTGSWFYDANTNEMTEDPTTAVDHLRATMEKFGCQDAWSLVDVHGNHHGRSATDLDRCIREADVFLNVTGAGLVRDDYLEVPNRIYVDTDPGYIQMRVANGSQRDLAHLRRHTHHFTFGANVGQRECGIPTVGLDWRPTRQPICLDLWPESDAPSRGASYTTILKWQSYDPVEFDGEVYGLKEAEFVRMLDLPGRTDVPLELATTGRAPVADLSERGWRTTSGSDVSRSLEAYRTYMIASRGEWSIAKSGYVKLRTGWFSDRSACYLALGRPVVVQSTGFEEWLPAGMGLLSFRDVDEAVAALEAVEDDYAAHSRAARVLAAEYFDARAVLGDLLQGVES